MVRGDVSSRAQKRQVNGTNREIRVIDTGSNEHTETDSPQIRPVRVTAGGKIHQGEHNLEDPAEAISDALGVRLAYTLRNQRFNIVTGGA